jgi:glycosyltransferase involved in cell wall biosynthesis
MARVLHVLPHRGGGAETYIDLFEGLDGFEHERVALSAGRTPASAVMSVPRSYPALARAVRRADVVHAHGDAAAVLALPLLARRASLWTTHGLHLVRRRPSVAPGVRAAIRATRVTLCTSQTERDELARLAPGIVQRLVVARNGLPPTPAPDVAARAEARAALGIPEATTVALFLGELEQRKGPLDAAAAARRVREGGAPLLLLVAGTGPQADAVAREGGEAVRMLGFRDDVEQLLAAADVFVLPSAREGLSFALLEAMRAALPIVVADGPGNAEALGEAGIVVPAGDRASLAVALTRLARDPAERRRLGAAAHERVAREFTAERLRNDVRSAYGRALTGPVRAGDDAPA